MTTKKRAPQATRPPSLPAGKWLRISESGNNDVLLQVAEVSPDGSHEIIESREWPHSMVLRVCFNKLNAWRREL